MSRAKHRDLRGWVDQAAIQLEDTGMPRIAGMIFAWLIVCEPAEQSAAELVAELDISKASVSSMVRLLESMHMIEKTRRPGARSDAYRLRSGSFLTIFRAKLALFGSLQRLAAAGLGVVEGPSARQRLQEFHDMHEFLAETLPPLLDQWEASRKPSRSPRRRTS